MSRHDAPERFAKREHRAIYIFGYLLIFGAALRRLAELDGAFGISLALILLGLFLALYASEPRLSRRFPGYPHLYFALQMILAQILGMFKVYQDGWALLYIALSFQVVYRCSRKETLFWAGLFVVSIMATMMVEFGPLSGMGRGLAYIVIGLFVILYDIQYGKREEAHDESQVLLVELQQAHQKLKEYTAQAEELATARERDRITRELHDSVGQKIFAIQLATESAFLLLKKDPRRAVSQLDLLQEQTQAALSQMRELIGLWRPD